jgi:hypothetical protein
MRGVGLGVGVREGQGVRVGVGVCVGRMVGVAGAMVGSIGVGVIRASGG